MNRTRLAVALSLLVLGVAALVALLRLGTGTPSDEASILAQQLSCPACAGQSVADSNSAVAQSMRAVIDAQIAEGKSADDVRAWFVQRYGPAVLRTSSWRDDILLWGVPIVIAAAMAVGAALTLRGRRQVSANLESQHGHRPRPVVFVAVGAGVGLMIGAVALASGSLDARSHPVGASAASPAPSLASSTPSLAAALAMLRSGQPRSAAEMAEAVAAAEPDSADALLILGLARRAMADPDADDTLRRFLSLAPQHPAAAEVRALLDHRASAGTSADGDATGRR